MGSPYTDYLHASRAEREELRATAHFERANVQVRLGRPAEAMAAYSAPLPSPSPSP